MVRRRSNQNRIEDTAPRWVLEFDPKKWPSESWGHSWALWRQAVREFAADTYKGTDKTAWLHVIRNLYGTRNAHWAEEGSVQRQEPADGVQRAIQRAMTEPAD